ncbi:MAG: hypothetical protein IRY99_11690 [Isosphaeraceae bacterium]|nr:hypothetical protein [Isosphaeraceae bacterium]
MASLVQEPQTLPTQGAQPMERPLSDYVARATDATARPDVEGSRQEGASEFLRILLGMIAVYAALIALPALLLIPIVVMGLVLGGIGLLVGGMT